MGSTHFPLSVHMHGVVRIWAMMPSRSLRRAGINGRRRGKSQLKLMRTCLPNTDPPSAITLPRSPGLAVTNARGPERARNGAAGQDGANIALELLA